MSMVGEDPKHEQSPKWREIDAIRKGKSDIDLAEQIWRLERSCADLHAQLTDMQGEVHRVEAMRSSEADQPVVLATEKGLTTTGQHIADCERDAARYRFMRNQDERFWIRFRAEDGLECDLFGHDLDAAIDAARSAQSDT